MTDEEFLKRAKAGELIAIGEWRSSKAEIIKWRDHQTGRAMEAPNLKHNVEFAGTPVAVGERVAEGTKLEDIHVSFSKGDMVVLSIETISRTKGLMSATGRLERLTSAGNGQPAGGLKAR